MTYILTYKFVDHDTECEGEFPTVGHMFAFIQHLRVGGNVEWMQAHCPECGCEIDLDGPIDLAFDCSCKRV